LRGGVRIDPKEPSFFRERCLRRKPRLVAPAVLVDDGFGRVLADEECRGDGRVHHSHFGPRNDDGAASDLPLPEAESVDDAGSRAAHGLDQRSELAVDRSLDGEEDFFPDRGCLGRNHAGPKHQYQR
jgi:hypothetical protein